MNRIVAPGQGIRNAEAGNTLVVALLVLFLLTSLGISYVAITKGEKQMAGNQLTSSQAFANAEAGISEVLARMSNPNAPGTTYIGQTPPGTYTPGWGVYVITDPGNSGLDPQYNATVSDGLDNDVDAATDETSEHYPERSSKQNAGMALSDKLDYPWVKVRYKLNGANQIVRFGDHDNNPVTPPQENLLRGVPMLIVTSAGRRGTGQKIVTVEAVKWPLPPVPGSVYTEGQMNFNGAAFRIDGHDHDYVAPYDTVAAAAPVPGISTTNAPTAITTQLNGPQSDNVEGAGSDPSVAASPINLDLQAMATAWCEQPDVTLTGDQNNPNTAGWGSVVPPPGTSNLKIVHIAGGDLHISGNASGAGVLVIDGDFLLSGSFNWNGIVIVLGDLVVTGGGIAKQIVGGIMVQGTTGGTTNLNGDIRVMYSSAMINQLNQLTRYEVSSWIDQ